MKKVCLFFAGLLLASSVFSQSGPSKPLRYIVAGTPEHFAKFLKAEVDRWAKVVKDAGIKAD